MEQGIAVPHRARATIERFAQERDRVIAMMEAYLSGLRAALDVPDSYVLRTLDEGFVPRPPEEQSAEQGEQ